MLPIIAALSDVLHFHSRASVAEVLEAFPFPVDRVVISAHGNYARGCADDGLSRQDARATLGIDAEDDVILSLGLVRPYKGPDLMFGAFRELLPLRPRLLLPVAGRVFAGTLAEPVPPRTPEEAARITITNGFVDPARRKYHLCAADVGLYTYRSILASGSLLLALTFGLPVVIPGVGMTREVLDGYDAGITYPPGSGIGPISSAISTLLARKDDATLGQMSANARNRAAQLAWPDFTPVLDKALAKRAR
ncbi:MAG: hypothetical protein NTX73_13230 [Rhodobacterales bacterium]|nr:hypothetical protein [Rhodobacterales bacterium]